MKSVFFVDSSAILNWSACSNLYLAILELYFMIFHRLEGNACAAYLASIALDDFVVFSFSHNIYQRIPFYI